MIEAAIYELLTGDTVVTSLVSNRCYPLAAPQRQGQFQAHVVYQRISHVMNRPLNGPNGFTVDRWQFDCFAMETSTTTAYDLAVAIADALRLALDGFRGDAGNHRIQRIKLLDGGESWEFETEGSEGLIVDARRDFSIVYGQAIAA